MLRKIFITITPLIMVLGLLACQSTVTESPLIGQTGMDEDRDPGIYG